jgi:probable F420-dependent oxidoreductase
MTPLKFGVVLPSYGPQSGRLAMVDTLLAAERLGFDSAWTTDHLALPEGDAGAFGHLFEAVTSLGYLAAVSNTIRLGVSALVLPQRNPVEVAKQIATLDVLSGGRIMLAAGIGWSAGEYANLGYNFKNRGKRMDEALQVLRTLWRGGRVISYQGKHYSFERVAFSPGPLQSGGPVLWVAGNSPRALRRAVFFADGWHPDGLQPEELARSLKMARPLLLNRPFTVSLRARLVFGESDPQVPLSGSPEQVTEKLRAYVQAGVTYAVLHFAGETHAARERSMQTFTRQVIPALN